MRAEVGPRAVAPDYEPTDPTGKHCKLSELQGPDPIMIVLEPGLMAIGPDGDITSPDMKAAWERGEKDHFYPDRKSSTKVFQEQE